MFWKEGVKFEILSFFPNHINVLIVMVDGDEKWRLIEVCSFSNSQMKHKTCELIDQSVLV